ncbi:MAG TPA: hypothetical protein VFL86_09440, partial [Burkholderiaceae bacterium]|nr:hypothetical protein [Burkholderiaceae bacterium]
MTAFRTTIMGAWSAGLALAASGTLAQQSLPAAPAAAASEPAAPKLESVIVTAERRAENIKNVPISIT